MCLVFSKVRIEVLLEAVAVKLQVVERLIMITIVRLVTGTIQVF